MPCFLSSTSITNKMHAFQGWQWAFYETTNPLTYLILVTHYEISKLESADDPLELMSCFSSPCKDNQLGMQKEGLIDALSGSCWLRRETLPNPPGPDLITDGGPRAPLQGSCIHQGMPPFPPQLLSTLCPSIPPCTFVFFPPWQDEGG